MEFSNKDFVHLHVHSDYSQFDGLAYIPKLVLQARKMGFPSLSLTDHGVMGGAIRFMNECSKTKDKKGNSIDYPTIKPIVGAEFYLARHLKGNKENQPDRRKGNRHIVLLAKNRQGYQNLCKLQTLSWTEGVYIIDPRIDIDTLAKHSEGLICGSGCLSGIVHANLIRGNYDAAKRAASIFKDIFGEDFYLEVQYHGYADEYINVPATLKLGKELDIPVVATNDVHYVDKDQAESQEVLMCMSTQTCLGNPKHIKHPYPEMYLKSAEEMAEFFGDFPEVLYNSAAIAERVNAKDIENYLFNEGVRLPSIDLPDGFDVSLDYLKHLAKEGLIKKGWHKSKPHIARLKREIEDVRVALDVNELDFPTYFLIVRDYINWATGKGIMVGGGRGSGYASVLLHCIGVCSGLDPLKYDLIWERFLGFDDMRFIKESDFGLEKITKHVETFPKHDEMIKMFLGRIADTESKNRADAELKLMSETTGLNGVNNLNKFYDVYVNFKDGCLGNIGETNEAHSWTSFYLGMTDREPTEDFLPLRRAYARIGYPDIDTDFCALRKDEVTQYIIDKYTKDYASQIGTYGTMKFRTGVARTVKALDLANSFHLGPKDYKTQNMHKVNEILADIPKARGVLQAKDRATGETIKVQSIEDAMRCFKDFNWYMTKKYPEVKRHVDNVSGLVQSFTVHPAGVVISSVPLNELVPQRNSKLGVATQYPHEELEELGIIKFDNLALSTLTTIEKALKLIKENYDIDIDLEALSSVDDKATLNAYSRGDLIGVFQCEEGGMQDTMRKIGVTCFDDIMAAIALYRPGPLQFIPQYCERKRGDKKVDYFHPTIEKYVKKFLEKTYGVMCYQEQIMQVCHSLAGFSIVDGYIMIKAVGKKKVDLLKQFKSQFIDGCVDKGVPDDVATSYWEKCIIPFADYGFNSAHAAAYGFNSYVSCYLKTHYPEEYMVSILNTENYRKKHELVAKYEKDLKKCRIKLVGKDINRCCVDYKIVSKANPSDKDTFSEISPTLMVKGNGEDVTREIENNAPYGKFRELVATATTPGSSISKENVGNLYDAGFLRNFSMEFKKQYKMKLSRVNVEEMFIRLRDDLKRLGNRGLEDQDLFG